MNAAPLPEPAPREVTAFRGAPGTVAVIGPDGQRTYVRDEDLPAAEAEGSRVATRDDMWATEPGAEYVAGAAGLTRGISFGLSDPLFIEGARALGGEETAEDARAYLRGLKQHQGASVGGEIAGSLATLMAGVPPAASAEVTASSLLGRAAQRVAAASPRLAAEGAAIGLGHQASEDALGDHEAVAENYVIAGLKGAALNVFLGGLAIGAGGAVTDRLALRSARAAEKAAAEAQAVTAYRTAGQRAELAVVGAAGRPSTPLARAAEEQAFKGVGAKLKDWQKLGRTAEFAEGRAQRIGRTLLDEGISTPGASLGTQAKRLTLRVAEVGEELGSIRKTLDRAAARPSAENVIRRIESEVVAPLVEQPFSGAEQAAVRGYVQEIAERVGDRATFGSFEELHKLRRALDTKLDPKLWSKVPGSAPQAAQELGKIRGILESEYEAAAETAARELGENIAQRYRVAKVLFADLKTAEKIAVKETARAGANRAISLTDTIAGAAGIAALGPQGLALAIANKAMRTYGNQVAAHVLDKASRIEALAKASQAIETKVQGAVKALLKGERAAAPRATSTVTDATVRQLRESVRTPDSIRARIEESIAHIGPAAPRVATATALTLSRAATYLAQNLPREKTPRGPAFLPGKAPPLSITERETAQRMIRGALEPEKVIDAIASGRVTREEIAAFRHVFPRRFEQIRGEIVRQAHEMQPQLTIQQEAALSVLWDAPMGQLTEPETMRGFSEAFASPETNAASQDPNVAPRAGGSVPAPKYRTETDRLEGGLE